MDKKKKKSNKKSQITTSRSTNILMKTNINSRKNKSKDYTQNKDKKNKGIIRILHD